MLNAWIHGLSGPHISTVENLHTKQSLHLVYAVEAKFSLDLKDPPRLSMQLSKYIRIFSL